MSPSVKEALEAAAESLEKNGWCQEVMRSWDGTLCVVGHLVQALDLDNCSTHDSERFERFHEARTVFARANRLNDTDIPDWNDSPSRTYEDVALGFKRAIEHAES